VRVFAVRVFAVRVFAVRVFAVRVFAVGWAERSEAQRSRPRMFDCCMLGFAALSPTYVPSTVPFSAQISVSHSG